MAMIPDQPERKDQIYSLIADGLKKKVIKYDDNRNPYYDTVLDEKKAWLKTGNVPSQYYGNYTFDAEEFRNLSEFAYRFMPKERADDLAQDVLLTYGSFCNGIDSLCSQTMRDDKHSQASLIDKGLRNKSERDIRFLEDGKKSIMEMFTGKEKHEAVRD